jgi:hypothetical protein
MEILNWLIKSENIAIITSVIALIISYLSYKKSSSIQDQTKTEFINRIFPIIMSDIKNSLNKIEYYPKQIFFSRDLFTHIRSIIENGEILKIKKIDEKLYDGLIDLGSNKIVDYELLETMRQNYSKDVENEYMKYLKENGKEYSDIELFVKEWMRFIDGSLWDFNYDHFKNLFFQLISNMKNAYPNPKFPDLTDFNKFIEVTKKEKEKIIEKYIEIKTKIDITANKIVIPRMEKIIEKQIE